MNREENNKLTEEIFALQADNENLKKDRDEWEKTAEVRLAEIRRLRPVIRSANENTDGVGEQTADKNDFWAIEGFGIELAKIYPMLDAEKLRLYLKETYSDEWFENTGDELYSLYRDSDNAARIGMIEKVIREHERAENLAVLICESDEKRLVNLGYDGGSRYFILYTPTYPWNAGRDELKTQKEAEEHIYNVLKRFLNDGVEKNNVAFDYVSEVGMS